MQKSSEYQNKIEYWNKSNAQVHWILVGNVGVKPVNKYEKDTNLTHLKMQNFMAKPYIVDHIAPVQNAQMAIFG